ncbi:hypothetical protein [Streptomyces sp. NPDC003996]
MRGASSSLYYRADLFKKYGLKVHTTLDEFAQIAPSAEEEGPPLPPCEK